MDRDDDGDALANLLRYFDALGRDDFDAAVTAFADDCEYYHPDYAASFPDRAAATDGGAHYVRGRAALLELLHERGSQPARHFVTGFARNGDHCFAEGHFTFDGDPRGSWVVSFSVDGSGRIRRYIPYSAIPPQPLVGEEPIAQP